MKKFQSTHPSRGATITGLLIQAYFIISIHAPLAGCDWITSEDVEREDISIHAPLAGCDCSTVGNMGGYRISIHAPLAGCDDMDMLTTSEFQFQSTHPSRGATNGVQLLVIYLDISIHAPLAGCDCDVCPAEENCCISIHAPLAGCDAHCLSNTPEWLYFNPRTPRGVRQPNFKIPTCSNTLIVSDNQYFYLFSYLLKRFIDIRRIFQVRTSLYFLNSLYFAP